MIFTNTDKALMMRAARHLATQAKTLEGNCGTNWARDKDSRRFKLEFDRFLRDERDLRELAKRLEKAAAKAAAEQEAKKVPALAGGFAYVEPSPGARGNGREGDTPAVQKAIDNA